MTKLLFVGQNDWASICNRVARALNKFHGQTVARVWTLNTNPLHYDEDVVGPDPTPDLIEFARTVDWVFDTGDGDRWYSDSLRDRLPLDPIVHLGTTHAGSAYRSTPDLYNEADARRGYEVRFIGLDSIRFAPNDPTVRPHISPAPGLRVGIPPLVEGRKIRVCHAPSNRATKGSALILGVLESMRDAIDVDLIEGIPYAECYARVGMADVLVDQIEPSIGGMGALAVEAMGLGLAVISDVHHCGDAWGRLSYPDCAIIPAGDADALRAALERLVGDREALRVRQAQSLAWAAANASPEGIARLWDLPAGRRAAPVPKPPPPRISAPMIVKNEERGIRKALESLVGVVDEVVVVDTGSTDGTVGIVGEVAGEWDAAMGAHGEQRPTLNLLHHPWQDDFSEARNFAQDACTGDWCVILDGDEVLEPGDLRQAIYAAGDHAIVGLTCRLEGLSEQVRAHRRSAARWAQPIHNQLTFHGVGRFAPSTTQVFPSYNKGKVRIERSKPMLLEEYEKAPLIPHAPYYLANLAVAESDWPEAKKWARLAVTNAHGHTGYSGAWVPLVHATFMVDGLEAAMQVADEGLAEHPRFADLWHAKANLCAVKWTTLLSDPVYLFQIETHYPPEQRDTCWKGLGFVLDDDAT